MTAPGIAQQHIPERSGHVAGKTVVPTEAIVPRLRAPVAARRSDEFMITAPTDASTEPRQ